MNKKELKKELINYFYYLEEIGELNDLWERAVENLEMKEESKLSFRHLKSMPSSKSMLASYVIEFSDDLGDLYIEKLLSELDDEEEDA